MTVKLFVNDNMDEVKEKFGVAEIHVDVTDGILSCPERFSMRLVGVSQGSIDIPWRNIFEKILDKSDLKCLKHGK